MPQTSIVSRHDSGPVVAACQYSPNAPWRTDMAFSSKIIDGVARGVDDGRSRKGLVPMGAHRDRVKIYKRLDGRPWRAAGARCPVKATLAIVQSSDERQDLTRQGIHRYDGRLQTAVRHCVSSQAKQNSPLSPMLKFFVHSREDQPRPADIMVF